MKQVVKNREYLPRFPTPSPKNKKTCNNYFSYIFFLNVFFIFFRKQKVLYFGTYASNGRNIRNFLITQDEC